MTNDERDEAINEIRVSVATIVARCPGCQGTLQEHHVALDGNGSRGLKTRVAAVEQHVNWLWGLLGAIGTAAITAVAGVGLMLLEKWLGN